MMKSTTYNEMPDVLEMSGLPKTKIKTGSLLGNMVQTLISKGGPAPEDYQYLDRFMEALYLSVQVGLIPMEEVDAAKKLFSPEFLSETIHGYGYTKPMGYAGDYLMIDKIYTRHTSQNPEFQKWDAYFHHNEATEAVRNRKAFFKKELLKKLEHANEPINLLNVASGPARDLQELYEQINPSGLQTECVELDERAIMHAKEICADFMDHITFHQKNILRFNTEAKYDVIWSAGLFDYFEDRIFILALKKFISWLKPGGEILIGNFSEDNSSRGYMELFGEWNLLHRSKEELIELAMQAGVEKENISVDQEPLGINLFLRIKV